MEILSKAFIFMKQERVYKRRHRQIGRLLYYYCCVRYLTKENGRWVKAMSDGVWLGDICNTNTDSESK